MKILGITYPLAEPVIRNRLIGWLQENASQHFPCQCLVVRVPAADRDGQLWNDLMALNFRERNKIKVGDQEQIELVFEIPGAILFVEISEGHPGLNELLAFLLSKPSGKQ